MSELPRSWLDVEIGSIADVVAGGTPKAKEESYFSIAGEGIAWLTPADLSGYKYKEISHGKRDISQLGLDNSSAKLMPAGSLLFSSRAPIGYVAIAANEIATNQGFKSFVFTQHIDSSYAYYYLKSIRGLAESRGTGTTFKELSGAMAKKLPFRLAPLNEQTRIANKLDSILAKVDKAQARLDKIPAILKRFRQSVLAAATSGELTKYTTYHSGEYYRELKLEIESNTKSKKLKPLSEGEVTLAHQLFDGVRWPQWNCYPLEMLVNVDRGIPYGIVQTGEHQEVGVPTIRCGDVKHLHIKTDALKIVSPEIEDKYARTRLKGREVLLAIRGTVGNAAVVTDELIDMQANISREVAMIPVRENINPHYIALLLQSPGGYRALAEKVRGVAQKGINLADVKRFVTPLPCLVEQGDIVQKVEELFLKANIVEKQYLDAKSRLDRLTQSILAKAFRGELVPQDPTDEPAEQLLERILKEREQAKPKKKATKKRVAKVKTVEKG
ncbi:restriction endonuclease subunit S [Vibrio sp. nBUS_14]|uniref:restriction endonuclease subunit S n=1 Tax=Vibrio sp. nBUS_14 TaxID=3395321 RepID=UPI003EBFEF0F